MGVFWRRRIVALAVLLAPIALLATRAASDGGDKPARAQPDTPPAEQPPILPRERVVAFYGSPDDPELGALGIGSPAGAARRLVRQARRYRTPRRPVRPAMELIASIATFDAGPDGLYRRRARGGVIARYLRAARSVDAILILDIQPGSADFLVEAAHLERWLREPDVHLALDPEWRVQAGQVPGSVIGTVDAREVNAVTAWLEQLVTRENLPPKLVVLHQFTFGMLGRRELIKPRRRVQLVINADGFGSRVVKSAKYRAFQRRTPAFAEGFKLFYREDAGLMTPRQVMRLRPAPDVVVYE